jgi:metal-responsive CopG/Arc/MetJ family transcriptional regulator
MLGVEQARGEFIVRNLQAIAAHTAIDWKAAAWLLERSEPETYAMRQYIEEEPALLKELKELVGAGLVSVREVKEQMPDLPTEYLNALMALETSIIDEQEVIPEQVIAGEAIEESKLPEALQQLK